MHRRELLNAGNDPIKIIAANKAFWSRKLGYLLNGRPLNEAFLFNSNTKTSYHPWSAIVMGEVFGDCGLKEFMPVKDYLNSTFIIDEFLEGMAVGMKKAANRKALELKRLQNQNKGKKPSLDIENINIGDIE